MRVRNALGSYNSRRILRRSMRRFIYKTFRFMRRRVLRKTLKKSPTTFGHPATRRMFRTFRSRLKSTRFMVREESEVAHRTPRLRRRITGRKFLQQLSLLKALAIKVRRRKQSRLRRSFALKRARAYRKVKFSKDVIKSRLQLRLRTPARTRARV